MSETLISLAHHNTTGVFESLVEIKNAGSSTLDRIGIKHVHTFPLAIGITLSKCESLRPPPKRERNIFSLFFFFFNIENLILFPLKFLKYVIGRYNIINIILLSQYVYNTTTV